MTVLQHVCDYNLTLLMLYKLYILYIKCEYCECCQGAHWSCSQQNLAEREGCVLIPHQMGKQTLIGVECLKRMMTSLVSKGQGLHRITGVR